MSVMLDNAETDPAENRKVLLRPAIMGTVARPWKDYHESSRRCQDVVGGMIGLLDEFKVGRDNCANSLGEEVWDRDLNCIRESRCICLTSVHAKTTHVLNEKVGQIRRADRVSPLCEDCRQGPGAGTNLNNRTRQKMPLHFAQELQILSALPAGDRDPFVELFGRIQHALKLKAVPKVAMSVRVELNQLPRVALSMFCTSR